MTFIGVRNRSDEISVTLSTVEVKDLKRRVRTCMQLQASICFDLPCCTFHVRLREALNLLGRWFEYAAI